MTAVPRYHAEVVSAQPLLDRLERVRSHGRGWMARCPAHKDQGPSLSITETSDKVLVHCFAGCHPQAVLDAVGLRWADLFPPRTWPDGKEQRLLNQRSIRDASRDAALDLLAMESKIALIAARQVKAGEPLSEEDEIRLATAVERIDLAANTLLDHRWRPMAQPEENRLRIKLARSVLRGLPQAEALAG
jgi:hypothetical protein